MIKPNDQALYYRKLAFDIRATAQLTQETAIRAELLMIAQRFDRLEEYSARRHQQAAD